MTTDQRIRLNMLLGVRNYGIIQAAVVKVLTKFGTALDLLMKTTDEIELVGKLQITTKTGLASRKNELKRTLTAMAVKNSNKLAILAKQTNNILLLEEIRFTETQLQRLPGTTLKQKAQIVYDRVESNLEGLAEQGITTETQKVFLETITAFNNALETPRTGIAVKRESTKKLLVLFETADSLLEIMDLAAAAAKDEYPDFYNGYRTSRKLVDTNTGLLALKAIAKELMSGTPVTGAQFTFIHIADNMSGGNGNGEKIVKKTSKKGSFHIKNMKEGNYTVVVKKTGFKQKEVPVNVQSGKRSELVVELEKA
jgi:hypothetical protein